MISLSIFFDSIVNAIKLIITLNPEVTEITLLSLRVSITAVILGALIAIPIAAFISFNKFFGKKIIINLIHTFMGLPPVVVGLFVYIILSRKGFLGGLDLLYTPVAMIIAQLIMVIPIITGVSLSAINGISKVVKETAISLGATKFQAALQLIKEARYGILTSLVTGFGAAISEVGAIILVGGNIRFHTRALTTAIVLETGRGNFELAMALGLILIGMSFIINFIITHLQQKGVKA